LFLFLFLSAFSLSVPIFGKVALLKIEGEIGRDIKASDIVEALDSIDKDPFYVAVIIDINSGGGSAVQSHEIVRALERFEKPKIAKIEDIGTSGAYWIASACDYIVADELSIVGGIGASSIFFSPQELMKKLGVEVYEISYPQNKSFGSPFFNKTFLPHAKKLVESAGEYFIREVAKRKPGAEKYLTGLPYLAKDAPELVDEYGGIKEALEKARELSGAKRAEIEEIEIKRSFRSIIKELLSSRTIFRLLFKIFQLLKF